jgi:probable rRNA maturation factor
MNIPVDITNRTKGKLPRLPFSDMKEAVLGTDYTLSLVFVGTTTARKLNKQYRDKDYATDILSFPLDSKNGEIFINPDKAKIKAKEFGRSYTNYLAFLFIHGLHHLKGMDHGSTMEKAEEKIRKIFSI